jgi:restriction endonuclease S subunit
MKKILLIFITLIVLISCSNDNRISSNNLLKEKLIGTWVNEGYYDDVATDENPNGFYPMPNGITTTYSIETFSSTLNGSRFESGNFNVSNDSILSHNDEIIGKISRIDDFKLIVTTPSGYGAIRYGKSN